MNSIGHDERNNLRVGQAKAWLNDLLAYAEVWEVSPDDIKEAELAITKAQAFADHYTNTTIRAEYEKEG